MERGDGFLDLECVAARAAKRTIHRGEQRDDRTPVIRAELDHDVRQLEHAVEPPAGTRPLPRLMSSTSPVRSFRELLAHDARRDERNGLHGRGRIAQRVHLPVGRRDLRRLPDQRAADVSRSARVASIERQVGAKPGDRLELVERAAGVTERRPDIIGTDDAERGDERRENERNLVTDAAGRVLVDRGASDARSSGSPLSNMASVSAPISARSRPRKITRHEQRGHLGISHLMTEVRPDELLPLPRLDPAAVALPFNELIGEHSIGSGVPHSCLAVTSHRRQRGTSPIWPTLTTTSRMRPRILPLLAITLMASTAFAQDSVATRVARGDSAYAAFDVETALQEYEAAIAADSSNVDALGKASRTAVDLGESLTDAARKKELFVRGEKYARRAVAADSTNAEAWFHLARAVGRTALTMGVKIA